MKVILAGSTGFIGHEVLDQCLANPAITSIVALSRRDIPSHEDHNKLQVVIMNDFLTYSEAVMKDLKSAEACIWYVELISFSMRLFREWIDIEDYK